MQEFLAVVLADAAESLVAQLTHAFVGNVHGFAHFAECLRGFLVDAEDTGNHLGFAFRKLFHKVAGEGFDALNFGFVFRVRRGAVGEHFGVSGLGVCLQRAVERNAALTDLDEFADFFVDFLTAALFVQSLTHAQVLVRRQANQVALFVDGTGNVSLDPPNAVADELKAAGMFERFDGADKAHGAFAHQVRQRNRAAAVLDGDLEHETHVGGNELLAGDLVAFLGFLEKDLFFFAGKGGRTPNIFEVSF